LRATLDADDHGIPPLVAELAPQVEGFPRHFGRSFRWHGAQ
jgi:hypothetical protein